MTLDSSTVAAIHRAAGDMGDAEKRLSAVLTGDSDEPVYSLREAVASLRKAADTLADAAEEEARR